MEIYESGENYLETILILQQQQSEVRSIDIANTLSFSKPSVSRAMKILKDKGYITTDQHSFIRLTPLGQEKAESIYERHQVLYQYLISIGVEDAIARKDACRMEHILSTETFDKIKAQLAIFQRIE